ncbi:MAG TPA: alpha amylase C-terminal domain-containing protein [Thermodesulfobacteriota bacterium]|nr:alpha amylase C-terminal domain-containing protein [Thermodesulfobacteriota bacterium]
MLLMERWEGESHVFCLFNFSPLERVLKDCVPEGRWRKLVDSSETAWNGPGTNLPESVSPGQEIRIRGYGFAMYLQEERV